MQLATDFLKHAPYQSVHPVVSPRTQIEDSRYLVRFAHSQEEVEAALKLRFEVFNLELGEGLDSSFLTGRDRDEFDATCNHLVVIEKSTDQIVGTYRVQTLEMAKTITGFYSNGEFELQQLPFEVLEQSVELGRACIAQSHRGRQVLFLLWKALAKYALDEGQRYLFGCCSLTSQSPAEGQQLLRQLSDNGYIHPTLRTTPKSGFECLAESDAGWPGPVELPQLFRTYLGIGARVCGPPAIDRAFKTIDFFVIFDLLRMNDRTRRLLFGK
jgi:putative hemolysin